jgi:hypothetical protein
MVSCAGQALLASAYGFYRGLIVFDVMFRIPGLRRLLISKRDVKGNRRMKTTVDPERNWTAEQYEEPLTPRRPPIRVILHFAIARTRLRLDERQTNAWTIFEDVPSIWRAQDAVGVPRLDRFHRTNPFVSLASQTRAGRGPALQFSNSRIVESLGFTLS